MLQMNDLVLFPCLQYLNFVGSFRYLENKGSLGCVPYNFLTPFRKIQSN